MSVAEQLNQAREAKQLTIEQVAEITKIRGDHLRALESGDYDVFSAPVYIRGFVRTYSTLLKLDVPRVMSALDQELGQTKNFAEPPPLTPASNGVLDYLMLQLSKIDWRRGLILAGVLLGLAAVAGGFWAWQRQRSQDPLREVKPAAYQPATRSGGETLPLPQPKR